MAKKKQTDSSENQIDTQPMKRDHKMASVGYRIPNYLADFISSFEDSKRGVNKSDIVRMILEIMYEQPWLLENYMQGKKITLDSFKQMENNVGEVNDKLNQFNEKFEILQETINSIKSQNQLLESIVEKLLGVSFAQIKQMPDQVLEQLYAGYLEKNTKPDS